MFWLTEDGNVVQNVGLIVCCATGGAVQNVVDHLADSRQLVS